MTPEEISRLIAVIMHTWPNHRIDDPEVAIHAWSMVLAEVPYPVASEALAQYMREGHEFAPNAGLLYQIVLDMTDALPNAGDAWTLVQIRIGQTYPGHPAPDWDAPWPVRQATKAMGGVHVLRMSENPMADRAHFIRLYGEYRKRAAREVNIGWLLEHGAAALEPGFIPPTQLEPENTSHVARKALGVISTPIEASEALKMRQRGIV